MFHNSVYFEWLSFVRCLILSHTPIDNTVTYKTCVLTSVFLFSWALTSAAGILITSFQIQCLTWLMYVMWYSWAVSMIVDMNQLMNIKERQLTIDEICIGYNSFRVDWWNPTNLLWRGVVVTCIGNYCGMHFPLLWTDLMYYRCNSMI